jgi:predicted metal-dependent hydrolase
MSWFKSSPPAANHREQVTITLADGRQLALLRVRDVRAKRMRLSVSERGVRLTLPRAVSLRAADAFVQTHGEWLLAQVDRFSALSEPALLTHGSSESIPLRGEASPLIWREGRYARAELTEHGVCLSLPAGADDARARLALHEFYLAQARADVGRWLPRYLPHLRSAPRMIRIRALSSLWGSLSASDVLSLDLALVLGLPAAFEYVLVHELCHLHQRNHSPAFWREVERHCPEWRMHRAWFRQHGLALKSTLRRLTAS